ncbi:MULTISPECIES: hypothetical protein [unclassified Pseudactinotalea]|uniref:hypothetical protein n=1 Tax=Micrococcales TaxID=85006 RepID=UPI003C7CDB8C
MTTATTKQAKMVAARRALAAAEVAVGVVAETGMGGGTETGASGVTGADGSGGGGGDGVPGRQLQERQPVAEQPGYQGLAVPGALAPLLPGGLRPGMIAQVHGSTTVLLAIAQSAAGAERWCVLVGMPDVGWAAAAAAGLDLSRVVAVPDPGPDAAAVLGALVDGFDVLLVGACPGLNPAGRRSLTGRLRRRGAVLLTDQHWPGAHVALQVQPAVWSGVGHGHGLLTGREMVVHSLGRGQLAGPARQVRVLAGADGLSSIPEQTDERGRPWAGDDPILAEVG